MVRKCKIPNAKYFCFCCNKFISKYKWKKHKINIKNDF